MYCLGSGRILVPFNILITQFCLKMPLFFLFDYIANISCLKTKKPINKTEKASTNKQREGKVDDIGDTWTPESLMN